MFVALIAASVWCRQPALSDAAHTACHHAWLALSPRVPAAVLAAMPRRGVSLHFETAHLSPLRTIGLHVYVVPAPGRWQPAVRREDIAAGSSMPKSPFYLALFEQTRRAAWRRAGLVQFTEDGDVRAVQLRWLHPPRRRGLVVLLRFGVGDQGEWVLSAFNRGLHAAPVVQTFGFGAGRTYSSWLSFDQVDRRGTMMVVERSIEGNTARRHAYRWNGRGFK